MTECESERLTGVEWQAALSSVTVSCWGGCHGDGRCAKRASFNVNRRTLWRPRLNHSCSCSLRTYSRTPFTTTQHTMT